MNSLRSPARKNALTLIELIVVITVIGILATIAIPATKSILDRAHRTSARNDAHHLKPAIASYYAEYRHFPTRQTGPESAAAPIQSDHTLMDILLASDRETGPDGLNQRRHVTFSGGRARPMGNGKFRSGVRLDENGGGTLWDPWGNHYRVIVDLNADSRVPAPEFVEDVPFLPQDIIVWSPGKDGDDATAMDNVTTW